MPLTEQDPLRGNLEFPCADHERQVEESLAAERERTPGLEQVVLRIGTILGERVDNQITRLWRGRFILQAAGAESPFVLVWDEDVLREIARALTHRPGLDATRLRELGVEVASTREVLRRYATSMTLCPL